jgi:XTP/dITP diphosphohydrolase
VECSTQPDSLPTSERQDTYPYPTQWRPASLHRLARPTLTIASGNPVKVAEIEAMLGPLPLQVRRQPTDLDVEENGASYLENARLKARAAAQRTGHWTLADDSGLEVDALDGAPGL